LGKKRGAGIVLDIKTGEILALVSSPSINPNRLYESFDYAIESGGKPFLNRALNGLYFPGSVFKIIVAGASLMQDEININEKYLCYGKNDYRIGCKINHGKVNLYSAFSVSCNSYFSNLGVMLGEKLLKASEDAGFNNKSFIPPIDGNKLSPTPSIAFKEKIDDDLIAFSYNSNLVAQCSIGQNLVKASPLHIAVIYGAASNKGSIKAPTLIKKIFLNNPEGKIIYEKYFHSKGKINIFPKFVAEQLLNLMKAVFEEKEGTGYSLPRIYKFRDKYYVGDKNHIPKNAKIIELAGKTGTAEVEKKPPHSWMVVVAPANAPRIVVVVIAENAGWGVQVSGPIAVDTACFALNIIHSKE